MPKGGQAQKLGITVELLVRRARSRATYLRMARLAEAAGFEPLHIRIKICRLVKAGSAV